jgi:hypothetical protein
VSCKTKNTRYYKHLPLVASLQQRKHRAYGSVLQFTSNVWDVYNDVLLSARIDRRATNKTTVQRLVLSRNFSYGDVRTSIMKSPLDSVKAHQLRQLCSCLSSYLCSYFWLPPELGFSIARMQILRIQIDEPMTEVSCAIHRPDTRGAVSCREVGKPVTEAPDSVRPRSIHFVGSIPRRSFTASRNFCLHPR